MTTSIWSFAKRAEPTRSGLVTARHPLAAAAGRELLRAGGNAVDAAIATILATGVVHPFATGLGGGGLLTVCGPDDGAASQTLDYRAEAPAAASPTCFELAGEPSVGLLGWAGVAGRANEIGPRSVGVPGTVTGLLAAHDRFGRAPWSDIVGPALVLARSGFETDWYAAMMQASHLEELGRYAPTARAFLRDGYWELQDVKVFRNGTVQSLASDQVVTNLKPEFVQERLARPETIPFYELPGKIEVARSFGLKANAFAMQFDSLVALPFLLVAMTLIAATVSMRFARMGQSATMILGGVLAGFLLYVVSVLVKAFGVAGFVPTAVAAWVPVVVAMFFGVTFLLYKEDG